MEPTASIALRAARKAGDFIVRASDDMERIGYRAKAAADYVTEVDLAAEKEILYQLNKPTLTTLFTAKKAAFLAIKSRSTSGSLIHWMGPATFTRHSSLCREHRLLAPR